MKISFEKGKLGKLSQGDLVWLDPNPVQGHEQGNYRPYVVISREETNRSNVVTLLPLTKTERKLPFRYPVEFSKYRGWVVIDQPRAFDLRDRFYQFDDEEFLSKAEDFMKAKKIHSLVVVNDENHVVGLVEFSS